LGIIRAWLLFLFAHTGRAPQSSSPSSLPQSDCPRETHGTHETNYLHEPEGRGSICARALRLRSLGNLLTSRRKNPAHASLASPLSHFGVLDWRRRGNRAQSS